MFDLRSDTVTQPTPAMREAMARAPVGDDVFGEDPTINLLQERTAELLGKEAALFVPSGTMANQISIGTLTRPGDEIVADAASHVLLNEGGSAARLWGCQISALRGKRGLPSLEDVESVIRTPDVHHPRTTLLSLENTHNYAGGAVLPQADVDALLAFVRARGIATHLDGARLFNASVASGLPPSRLAQGFDLVSTCLSKGLGAPAGSLVAGSREDVATCHRLRKALGGGMRQAGILAAAGLMALEQGPELLERDHGRARVLADELARLPGLEVDPVETNIVFITTAGDANAAQHALEARGVLSFALGPRRMRFVFHRDAGDDALEAAVTACRAAFA